MIRVTVELIPFGYGEPELLGTMTIANDGKDTFQTKGQKGSYQFVVRKKQGTWKRVGHVTNFPRKSLNVWYLIARCLKEAEIT